MITLNVFVDGKKGKTVVIPESFLKLKAPAPKPTPVEKRPLIRFGYPSNNWDNAYRNVRLISANDKYFWGLEVRHHLLTGKEIYTPKKFLRSKAYDVRVIEFSPDSMP